MTHRAARKKWEFVLFVFLSALWVYNAMSRTSIWTSVVFHVAVLLSVIGGMGWDAYISYRDGPDVRLLHPKSRYWATFVIAVIFIPASAWLLMNFTLDVRDYARKNIQFGRYEIASNDSLSTHGYWLGQKIKLRQGGHVTAGLFYIFHFDFLREGKSYDVLYFPRSQYIISASPVNSN